VLWRLRPSGTIATGSPDAGIVVGCEWLAWLLAGYLAIAVTVLCIGHVSQAFGIATTSLRAIAPARLRRLVDAAISIGVAGAIVGSVAAAPAGAATSGHVVARPPTVAGSPFDWPGLSPVAAAPTAHHAHPRAHGPSRVDRSGHRAAATSIVVQPGDTLWTIASRRLGAGATGVAITAAWHAWYAANRSTIGPDPNLIRPGQRLTVPALATSAARRPDDGTRCVAGDPAVPPAAAACPAGAAPRRAV
jgi:Tfp pilus assembly protein FimV